MDTESENVRKSVRLRSADTLRFRALREGVFAFLTHVPATGFVWRSDLETPPEAAFSPPPFLLDPARPGAQSEMQRKAVLHKGKEIGLHRVFGALAPGTEPILEFANQYGLLGVPVWLIDPSMNPSPMWIGEPLEAWIREINGMRSLIRFWDLVQKRDSRALSRHVRWQHKPARVSFWPGEIGKLGGGYELLALEGDPRTEHLLGLWRDGDPVEPARYYVHRCVNDRLKGQCSPAVLPYVGPNQHKIAHFPHNLLAAMYVLFALELAANVSQEVCLYCRQPFTPRRSNQHYCDARCRRNASYHRVKKAKGGVDEH